jgi:lysophospholipase L1-like esterase
MRGPEFAEQPTGYRVLAIGNSCTFGWGVEENSIWTRQLETILRKELPFQSIEVINAGVPGYSSLQGKRYFQNELVELKPKLLLIMFGWNDQWTAGKNGSDKDLPEAPAVLIAAQNLFNRLKVYEFLRKIILSNTETIVPIQLDDVREPRRVSLVDFALNLKAIIQTAKQNNIQPVLLVPPIASLAGYFGGAVSDFHTRHELYQRQILDLARVENVPVINLQIPFDQQNTLFDDAQADPVHFNAAGHSVTARTIADTLIPLISR